MLVFGIDVFYCRNCLDNFLSLLTLLEFGVFVDVLGQRTRHEDLKWNGLPLAFSKFIIHVYQGCHWSGKSQGNARLGKSEGILEFVREN